MAHLLDGPGLEAHIYYEAAAVIIALILLGRLLESRAKSNTSTAIRKLIGLQPKEVIRILEDGTEQVIRSKQYNRRHTIGETGDKIRSTAVSQKEFLLSTRA